MEPGQLNFDISLDKDGGALNSDGKTFGPSATSSKSKLQKRNSKPTAAATTVSYQPDVTQEDVQAGVTPRESAKASPSIFSVEYWQPHFNLETAELKKRVFYSLNPAKTSEFLQLVDTRPDLYGPFWICSFLIFTIIISSSLASAMKRILLGEERLLAGYNYENIGFVFCLIYGFLFGFPLVFTILLKVFGSELTFIKVSCGFIIRTSAYMDTRSHHLSYPLY
jgi:Yip1 domain